MPGIGPWKLWLTAPDTEHNIKVLRPNNKQDHPHLWHAQVLCKLEGLRYILQEPGDADTAMLDLGEWHIVLTFALSVHIGLKAVLKSDFEEAVEKIKVGLDRCIATVDAHTQTVDAKILKDDIKLWMSPDVGLSKAQKDMMRPLQKVAEELYKSLDVHEEHKWRLAIQDTPPSSGVLDASNHSFDRRAVEDLNRRLDDCQLEDHWPNWHIDQVLQLPIVYAGKSIAAGYVLELPR
ncbi:hypothetical protein CALVIDRAFT_568611 [Calocera viscosa TUFC12733]|uniref:Uncharacterized protein n=1 Tax=Calocera viscosa (strain TUFC12733) TaxID=1330018 RepID=A0A167GUV9_CALVF|nr:hypothetical protein CALVIDRAFT_568611 [Calocera viscosa TUFC12733]